VSLNGPVAARLYDEHVDAIYAYAARRVGPDAAVTVVEEVFEQALRKNAERPPHTSSDLGWLLAMTTAFLRRHSEVECRRLLAWDPAQRDTSRVIPRVSDPLLSNDAEDPSVAMTTQVMAAIADLEPVERDVLFLVAWEGCSSALTATATGLPPNEIRPTLTRIRKEIRRAVAETKAAAATTQAQANPTETNPTEANPTEPPPIDTEVDANPTEPPPIDAEVDAETWVEAEAWVDSEVKARTGADPEFDVAVDPDATEPLARIDNPLAPFADAPDEDAS
jgi:DNA-directed RNA polymerase specialized sigma24 family protein